MKKTLLISTLALFLGSCMGKQGPENPGARKETVTRKPGRDTVPFIMVNKHLIVEATIYDTIKLKLLFDTGAGLLHLDSAFTKRLGLFKGNFGPTREDRVEYIRNLNTFKAKKAKLQIGSITDSIPPTILNLERIMGQRANGIIGLEFMRRYLMEINYKKQFFVFHRHGSGIPAGFNALSFKSSKDRLVFPFIDVEFHFLEGFTIKKKAVIDLGAGVNYVSWGSAAVNEHHLLDRITIKTAHNNGKYITLEPVTGYSTRIKSMMIGENHIDTPLIKLNSSKSGYSAANVISMGSYIFSKFDRIFLDIKNGKLYLPEGN